jgi:hypothetical protein
MLTVMEIKERIEICKKRAETAKENIFVSVSLANALKKENQASQEIKLNLQIAENYAREAERAEKKAARALAKIRKAKGNRGPDKVQALTDSIGVNFREAEKGEATIKSILSKLQD